MLRDNASLLDTTADTRTLKPFLKIPTVSAWVDAPPEVIAAAIAYFKAYLWSAPALLVN